MHRFHTATPLPAASDLTLAGPVAQQIARVLRLRPGDEVSLFDDAGCEVVATLAKVTPTAVTATVARTLPPAAPLPVLQLYQALIRPNRFEWLIEKATELGATAITPVLTAHCQVRPAELGQQRAERWRRIATEAAEQCGRRTLPRLAEPLPFATALTEASGLLLIAWEAERETATSIGVAVARWLAGRPVATPSDETAAGATSDAAPAVSLFVGPEGGFTAEEIAAARRQGAIAVSLGPFILRAETAALAALALASEALRSGGSGTAEGRRT